MGLKRNIRPRFLSRETKKKLVHQNETQESGYSVLKFFPTSTGTGTSRCNKARISLRRSFSRALIWSSFLCLADRALIPMLFFLRAVTPVDEDFCSRFPGTDNWKGSTLEGRPKVSSKEGSEWTKPREGVLRHFSNGYVWMWASFPAPLQAGVGQRTLSHRKVLLG